MLFSEEKYLEIKEDNGVRIHYICKASTNKFPISHRY